jgi:hypothetical protein
MGQRAVRASVGAGFDRETTRFSEEGDFVPTRELILKIAALAGDERGDPAIRAVAYEKLAVLKDIYPHLFWMPGEDTPTAPPEPDAPPWADVRNRR